MRKLFTLLLLQSVLILNIQSADLVRVLSFYDLTSARMNKSHTDNQGNSITVSTNEPSENMFFYRTIDNPLSCIGETPAVAATGSEYATVVLKGEEGVAPENSPYILIELSSQSKVKEIRLIGRGGSTNPSNGGELLYGYSNTTSSDADFYLTFDGTNPVEGWMFFYNTACNVYGDLTTSIAVPQGARYIKIIATKQFLINNSSSLSTSTMLYALDFYAEDVPTGISDNTSDTFEISQENNTVRFTEPCNLNVYNLSGSLVLSKKSTRELSFGEGCQGVYLIKAVSVKTGKSYMKKIIL